MPALRAWVLGESGLPEVQFGTRQVAAGDGPRDARRRNPQTFMFEWAGFACATFRFLKRPLPVGPVLDQARTRRHCPAGWPMLMLAQGETMPVAELRNGCGGGPAPTRSFIIGRSGRHQGASASKGFQRFRPIATASSGFILPPHDPSIFVSAADILQGTAPPEKFAGKLVLIGTSAVGLTTSRPRRFFLPCRGGNPRPGD